MERGKVTIGITALEASAQAPEWIRLLPLGVVDLADGRQEFTVSREDADLMVKAFRQRGIDLVVDYEHQSLAGERAPAAGWIKDLESREDGLWAKVEWTEQARAYLVAREYRYFSPVLRLDPETRHPVALMHVGLTNVPAINHLDPLVAKANEANRARTAQTKKENTMKDQLMKLLGVTGDKPDEEILALADTRFKLALTLPEIGEVLGLKAEEAAPSKIKGAILALMQGQDTLAKVQADLEALKADQARREAQEAVTEALKAGKLQPTQKDWALEYAGRDLEGFKTFVDKAPKIVPVGADLKVANDRKDGKNGLTPDELTACKALGVTPEAFKAEKDKQATA